jgi:hypothetical protein
MSRSKCGSSVFRPSVQLFRTGNSSHQLPGQTQAFSAPGNECDAGPQNLWANIEYYFIRRTSRGAQ